MANPTGDPQDTAAPSAASLRDQAQALRAALAKSPDRADLYVRLGDVESQRERAGAAAAAYRAALERDPDLPGVRRRLGEQLLALGQPEAAESYLRDAVLEEPGDDHLHRAMAEACELRGHFAEAVTWWRRARALNAGSARVRRRLAAALLRREHWAEGWRLGRSFITVPGLRRTDITLAAWSGEAPGQASGGLLLYHEPVAPLPLTLLGLTLVRQVVAAGWRVRCTLPAELIALLARLDALPAGVEVVADALPMPSEAWTGMALAVALADLPRFLPPPVSAMPPSRRPAPESMTAATLLVPGVAVAGVLGRSGLDAPRRLWETLAAAAPGPVRVTAPAPPPDDPATAAALADAALVVSADPAILALAAYLERPTLGLLPPGADWWWGGRPDRSPWHPTVRLVRAAGQGGGTAAWDEVAASAAALLAAGVPPPAGWPPLHAPEVDPPLAETLDRLPAVFPRPARTSAARLTGGSHNTVYRVRDAHSDCVVRVGIFQPSRIDSYADERHNLRVAGALGIGARLLFADPVDGTLVLDYVKGTALSSRDLRVPGTAEEAAMLYRRLHGGPAFRGHYAIVRKLADSRQALVRAVGHLEPAAAPLLAAADEAARLLAAHKVPERPTHNDPIGANFLRSGDRLRLIDWQCAGMGDPHWEVAALAVQCRFPDPVRAAYLATYFGRRDHPALCRIPLFEVICCAYWWVEYARDALHGDPRAAETAQGWLRRGLEVAAGDDYAQARQAGRTYRWQEG